MNYNYLIIIFLALTLTKCASTDKESDVTKRTNTVYVKLKNQPKNIPGNYSADLKELTFSSGSFTSINMEFEKEEDDQIVKFMLFLPAAEAFPLMEDFQANTLNSRKDLPWIC